MKKTDEDRSGPLNGCNCLNCRLGRIEEQLNHIQQVLESLNLPANPGRNPGNNPKKSSKEKKKKK